MFSKNILEYCIFLTSSQIKPKVRISSTVDYSWIINEWFIWFHEKWFPARVVSWISFRSWGCPANRTSCIMSSFIQHRVDNDNTSVYNLWNWSVSFSSISSNLRHKKKNHFPFRPCGLKGKIPVEVSYLRDYGTLGRYFGQYYVSVYRYPLDLGIPTGLGSGKRSQKTTLKDTIYGTVARNRDLHITRRALY